MGAAGLNTPRAHNAGLSCNNQACIASGAIAAVLAQQALQCSKCAACHEQRGRAEMHCRSGWLLIMSSTVETIPVTFELQSTTGPASFADLSSLTSLALDCVRGAVLPPDGQYLSRLRSLQVASNHEVGAGHTIVVSGCRPVCAYMASCTSQILGGQRLL